MRRTQPLFRFDPGWLFTVAGLAIIMAAALLPTDRDLYAMREQLRAMEAKEAWNDQRLQAYASFQKEFAERDPALMRRLAASQLNLMPQGEQPLLMATSIEHTVSDWIEATVPPVEFEPVPAPDTLLSRLAEGPRRLWLMGGGAMMVFVGLVAGIGVSARPTLPVPAPTPADVPAEVAVDEVAGEAHQANEEAEVAETSQALEAGEPDVADVPSVADLPDVADMPAPEAEQAEAAMATVEESMEAEPQVSTPSAEAVEQPSAVEWSEVAESFDCGEADSGATPDVGASGAAEPWSGAGARETELDENGWLREHGSD